MTALGLRKLLGITWQESKRYFSPKHGVDIQPAPHVHVPNFVAKDSDVQEQNERYLSMNAQKTRLHMLLGTQSKPVNLPQWPSMEK
jgi:hypothetical protein